MKITLSENGHNEEFNPLEELDLNVGIMPKTPYGDNYYYIGFENESSIYKLLKKYDESEDLKFYFNKEILYIVIKSEPVHYTLRLYDEDLLKFCEQIRKDNKLLIVIFTKEEKIENVFGYDIII